MQKERKREVLREAHSREHELQRLCRNDLLQSCTAASCVAILIFCNIATCSVNCCISLILR